jgi:ankyrin repeat protein
MKNKDMALFLLKNNADYRVKSKEGANSAFYAIFSGFPEVMKVMLDRGQDVNEKIEQGMTLLHGAAVLGTEEMLDFLIENGAEVNIKGEGGETPLYFAAVQGKLQIVKRLLEKGADTSIRLKGAEKTALHEATLRGFGDVVELLLESGADADTKDCFGKTPLQYAVHYGHKDIADLLKEKGAPTKGLKMKSRKVHFLGAKCRDDEAAVMYLGNAGWAVKTKDRILIFDYIEAPRKPDEPSFRNGYIIPEEMQNKKVYVFVTHGHGDHFSPVILDWKKSLNDVSYIYGFEPQKVLKNGCVGPREIKVIDGMEIETIASTDEGVAFLVKVDDLVLFHAGDHANDDRKINKAFSSEIDYLAERNYSIDIAFISITGCGFRDDVAVKQGVYYALDKLQPKVMFPMHADGNEYLYKDFIDGTKVRKLSTKFAYAEARGDEFFYQKGNIIK